MIANRRYLGLLGLALTLPAWTQEAGQEPPSETLEIRAERPLPVFVSDPPGLSAPPADLPEVVWPNEDGGQGELREAQLDDSIPLPIPAVVAEGADGDQVVTPASGDPWFLGFEAGNYYPPPGEALDPALQANVRAQYTDGRPDDVTYGFAMFSKRITPERIAELEALGARVLGFHPHYTLRVAVPARAVDALAAHDAVHWLGVARPWQKVHTMLTERLAKPGDGQPLDVYVNVFESDLSDASSSRPIGQAWAADPLAGVRAVPDELGQLPEVWMSNGWQQRALEGLGLKVVEYVESIQAFRARMHPASLEQVVALDFVQYVELEPEIEFNHDESTPLIMADRTRASNNGGANGVGVVGIIDSGYDYGHTGLNHVWGWGWDLASTSSGAWGDLCEHGSHVAGTVLGLPTSANLGYTGVSPGLGSTQSLRVYNVKMGTDACSVVGSLNSRFAPMRTPVNDGSGNITPIPHAINCSWGSNGSWTGTDASARTLDAEVYSRHQLYVFSAGNSGSAGGNIGTPAVAKNAFTVGALVDYGWSGGDPGSLFSGSSRGPAADNRWKPNIAAPGRWIRSVNANNSTSYKDLWGTSMAAPHVTGSAVQLADRYSYLRYQPDRLASALMAAAFTHNDQSLAGPSTSTSHHYNMYGAGKLNLYRATFASSSHTTSNWGFTGTGSNWHFADVSVASGTTRLIVVMTYHEAASSSGASQALVNDWDLWIDSPTGGIAPGGNTGEYFAQQSPRDNTEIRIINNPAAGTWRWKVYPDSVSSNCEISVAVARISGDTTPAGSLSLTASDGYVKPNENIVFTATASNPDYNASSIFLDSSSTGDSLQAATTTLKDGAVTNMMTNQHGGRDITLGSLYHGTSRSATWTTRWASEGLWSWNVNARSDNWVDRNASVFVRVDGTPPGDVTALHSTTHVPSTWSNDPNVTFNWNAATDNLSGIDGYGLFTTTAPSLPGAAIDIGPVTSVIQVLTTLTGGWYFNIRSVDRSGNWAPGYKTAGPYLIDTVLPSTPAGLASTSHTQNVISCDESVTMTWGASTDAHSGLAGYASVWDHFILTQPTGALIIPAGATSHTQNVPSSGSGWYFHLRPRDSAGNWGTPTHSGPYFVNAQSASTYCTAKLNSAGCTPRIGAIGQPSLSGGNFKVIASQIVNNKTGILFYGGTPGVVPFQGGLKCVLAPTRRTPLQDSGGSSSGVDCSGTYSFTWTGAYLQAKGISIGDSVYCQWWYRDPNAAVGTTGLSNALRFTVCQ